MYRSEICSKVILYYDTFKPAGFPEGKDHISLEAVMAN